MLSAAKCPQCHTQIMLESTDLAGFCLHCGKKIDVAEAIALGGVVANRADLAGANQYLLAQNYEMAQRSFDAMLQDSPESHEAWWGKFQAADGIAGQTDAGSIAINGKVINLRQLVAANPDSKLKAIKQLKDATGLGLKACKDIVDAVYPRTGYGTATATDLLTINQRRALEELALGRASGLLPIAPQNLAYAQKAIDLAPEQMKAFYRKKLEERNTAVVAIVMAEDKGKCYIATAVYGSYNAPEVYVLRQYRDETLAVTPVGRLFITWYYRLSPALARRIDPNSHTGRVIRFLLNAWVAKCRKPD